MPFQTTSLICAIPFLQSYVQLCVNGHCFGIVIETFQNTDESLWFYSAIVLLARRYAGNFPWLPGLFLRLSSFHEVMHLWCTAVCNAKLKQHVQTARCITAQCKASGKETLFQTLPGAFYFLKQPVVFKRKEYTMPFLMFKAMFPELKSGIHLNNANSNE